jgi:sigma-B regulation protein RsbU (phosphoserine phosphatase)
MDSLELFGTCHPARGVGGDYYDFIVVGPGKIGVAVADVAGKGISAALLMSTIQASLRSQAPAVNGRLTELVSSMNELLHGATEANSFASFFYAQFDEVTRLLTYVNAGHNPPILLRGTAPMAAQAAKKAIAASYDFPITAEPETLNDQPARTTLLCTGGPVIGAFQRRAYEQEAIELESGDVLVAYTDGVTEAQNPAGEEFGETRLQQLTASLSHLPANELSDSIVSAVRDWRREAPQHDDLTLVVMRVK